MVLAGFVSQVIIVLVGALLTTLGTLVYKFVIGAASDDREEIRDLAEENRERLRSAEQSCAKAERLSDRVDENERRSSETQADLEELMRYLLGTDRPDDDGAIRGMHNSIEDVRSDVHDLREQNQQIEREVKNIGRTNTDIAYSFHEIVELVGQLDGVDSPDISLRDDFRGRDDRRPDGGVETREVGPHEDTEAYDWLEELKESEDDEDADD